MATASTQRLLQHLRQTVLPPGHGSRTDGQLLEDFLLRREEAAFRALVQRHGAMVLGVCRRVLGDPHDAEDAFQATFLVLVRKAALLRQRDTIGNYLYGVAYHTALKARAAAGKRRAKERLARPLDYTGTDPDALLDLRPLLDRELNRLPEKYRTAVVLCHLEGRPRSVAARQLGIPEGTLSSRLATARRLLATRLARHGLVLSAVAWSALAPQASAGTPAGLVRGTVGAATLVAAGQAVAISAPVAALTEGVLQAMRFSRFKIPLAALLAGSVLAAGIGFAVRPGPQAGAAEQQTATAEDAHQSRDRSAPRKLLPETPPPPEDVEPPVKADNRLDNALKHCEQKLKRIQNLRAQLVRTMKDNTYETTEVYEGKLEYQKPGRFLLEMHRKDKPDLYEKYVCSGTTLYEYAPRQKAVRVHTLPLPPFVPRSDDLPCVLVGLKADEFQKRYDVRLVKEDRWYSYIEIRPRQARDRDQFTRARLVLMTSTFLPRQIWFQQCNGVEITWDIPRIETDVRLDSKEFESPRIPTGWRVQRLGSP
jgi:TIGR03009 family protein